MPTKENNHDLLKLILNLLIIGLFLIIAYYVVEPFLFGFFWALMVVIGIWPVMLKIQHYLFNNRFLAVLIITTIIALIFIIPFLLIIATIFKNGQYFIEWTNTLALKEIPRLNWLSDIPLFGGQLHQEWLDIIETDGANLINEIQPYIGSMATWFLAQVTNVSILIFHAIIMIIFSVLLLLKGEKISIYVYHFAKRLSRQYGETAVSLAGQAVRAVALGVVVTAVILALIGGTSFILTQMPYAGFLTLILFICCVIQIGPVIVMLVCILWQFWDGNTVSATALIVVAVILTTLDSVMRAFLIKKGADLPFLLILFGVIGGLFSFGIAGIFIGPVVLAVGYKLIQAWIDEQA